jgi:hypothetical protein
MILTASESLLETASSGKKPGGAASGTGSSASASESSLSACSSESFAGSYGAGLAAWPGAAARMVASDGFEKEAYLLASSRRRQVVKGWKAKSCCPYVERILGSAQERTGSSKKDGEYSDLYFIF